MIALLITGTISMTTIWIILSMLQFAVGEPTGKHSRFNPKAIPVTRFTDEVPVRKLKPAKVYTVVVPSGSRAEA